MKKAFILLFAALMITCLFVSCEPDVDPDTVTDQFKGNWILAGGFDELRLEFDGEGNFKYTKINEGEIEEQYSGTYTYDASNLKFEWYDDTHSKHEHTTEYTLSGNELTLDINGFTVTLKR